MLSLFFILFGLTGLWFGTKWVISGAMGISKLFNLSHSFVGIAVLAIGTDLPEIFVSINASVQNLRGIESSGIITGNAIGSCLSQITIVLGISGLFLHFTISRKNLIRNGIALLSSLLLLFIFSYDGIVSRPEGVVLILVYIIYYAFLLKNHSKGGDGENSSEKTMSFPLITFYLTLGFGVLIYSSHLVVGNAMLLAEKWGVAQSFIGIVLIGLGTSLPELAVSIGAALNKSPEMSIGNIIGSNIFDGLIPVGIGGLISTTSMENNLLKFDLPYLFAATLIVLFFLRTKRGISHPEGIVLILIYLLYVALKIIVFHGQ